MRQSFRDKQNRKARINKEKEDKKFEKKGNKKSFSRNENRGEVKREEKAKFEPKEKDYEDVVAGRNAVLELLKSEKDINKIFVERGEKHGSINEIIAKAKDARVVLVELKIHII